MLENAERARAEAEAACRSHARRSAPAAARQHAERARQNPARQRWTSRSANANGRATRGMERVQEESGAPRLSHARNRPAHREVARSAGDRWSCMNQPANERNRHRAMAETPEGVEVIGVSPDGRLSAGPQAGMLASIRGEQLGSAQGGRETCSG
jgi:hypothetical protein